MNILLETLNSNVLDRSLQGKLLRYLTCMHLNDSHLIITNLRKQEFFSKFAGVYQ